MAEQLDEFGIPIKQVESTESVDEFGIPVKKKVTTPDLNSGGKTTSQSVSTSTSTSQNNVWQKTTPSKVGDTIGAFNQTKQIPVIAPTNKNVLGEGTVVAPTKEAVKPIDNPYDTSAQYIVQADNTDTGLSNVSQQAESKRVAQEAEQVQKQRELANPNSFENIGAQYKAKALNMSGNNDVEKMIKYGDVNGNMAFLSEMLDDNDKPLFETKSAIDKIDKVNKIYEQQLKSGSITPEQFDAHKKENDKKAIELNTQYVQQMQKRNSSIDDEIKQSEQKLARGYDMKMLGAQPYSVQLTKQEIDSEKKKIKQLTDLKNDVLIDINNPVKSLEKHDGYVQAEKQGLIPTNATNSQKVKIYSYILVDKAKKLATELGYNPNDVKSLIGDELGSNTPKMWWEQLKSLVVGSSDKEREYIHTMAELQAIAPIAILNKNNLTLNEGYTSNLVSSFRKSVAPLFVRNQIATDEDRNTLTKEAFNKAGVNDGVSQAYTDRQATTEKESKTLGKTVARTTGDVVGIGVKIGLINPILDIPAAGIEMAVGKPVLSGLNKALSTSKEVQALEAEALLKAGETATKASEIASIDKAKKVLDIAKVVTEKLPNNFLTRTIYNTTKAGVVHEIQGRVNKELEGFANFEVGAVNHLIGMPLNTLGKVAIRLFGKDAPAFVSQVVHAVQAGTSMTATMAGMTVVNDAKESESFDAFKEKMNEQFGTADKKLRFIAENFLLGLTMHAANISTLSGLFNANYTKLYESLKPEEKAKVDEFVKSVNEDANDFESETKDAVEIVKDENHIPITKDAEVEDAIKPATDGSKLNDIGEGEYKEFIDNGKVAPERLNNIAEKVKNKEDLSEREKAIFADKTAEINDIIKNGSTNNQQIKDETKITPIKPVEQGQQNNDGTGLSETAKEEVEGVSGSALKDVGTKQQIENFGVPKEDVDATHGLLNQVFSGLKKAGLTAAKTVGDWVGIGKGSEKPYSLKIGDKEVQVKNTQPEVVNGFYSPLEKVITESKFDKLPAKQWAEKYANSEEAKWTGLKDWLAQQQGSVSKADIQQFLKDNRIQVVEVVNSGKSEKYYQLVEEQKNASRELDILESDLDNWSDENYKESRDKKYELNDKIKELSNQIKEEESKTKDTKFKNYQLEGQKENYKEVLVTLPIAKSKQEYVVEQDYRTPNTFYAVNQKTGVKLKFGSYELAKSQAERLSKESQPDFDKQFKSSHFDEPNILVHLRTNLRTDAEGKKVLFLEEVQSDWGQKGKKEGFKSNERDSRVKELVNKRDDGTITEKERQELGNLISESYKAETPTAPFVTDTNAWTKLGLKVALKEAVKQGADKIAWTTGEQQNERYDLSKQINQIDYRHENENSVWVDVFDKDDHRIESVSQRYAPNELENTFGKDVANKIINRENLDEEGGNIGSLTGVDLKVGGKGMKGFYGSPTEGSLGIVGNVAKSLFKQEPKTVKIPRNNEWVVTDNREIVKSFQTEAEAKKYAKEKGLIAEKNIQGLETTQHSIDITPELKASVEGGQPLFKDAEAQYRIESGKNIIEAIKDFNQSKNKARATVALTHEIMHPTVVSIIDGAKEGNEVGTKHTETIVNEFNKANPNSKVTVEDLIKGNDAFKDGTTSKQYRQVQEFIAKAWEKYHTEGGKGFSEAFQKVLDQITKAFQSVYKSITGKQLTPELKQMFDDILGKEAPTQYTEAETPKDDSAIQSGGEQKLPDQKEVPIEQKQEVSDEKLSRLPKKKKDANIETPKPVDEPIQQAIDKSKEQGTKEAVQPSADGAGQGNAEGKSAILDEIKSKNLTHVRGKNMGENQALGTFVSTEKGNRYETKDNKAEKVEVDIKNPLVVDNGDFGLVDKRQEILNANRDKFDEYDTVDYQKLPDGKLTVDNLNDTGIKKLAELTTNELKAQGYDGIYFRESGTQEGELVVFDKSNVKFKGEEKPQEKSYVDEVIDKVKQEQVDKKAKEEKIVKAEEVKQPVYKKQEVQPIKEGAEGKLLIPKDGNTVKTGEANEKFKKANKVEGEDTTIEMPNGETRSAKFVVVELDDIMASHDENSFNNTDGYPSQDGQNVNPRNYKDDVTAKAKVINDAKNLKPSIVISDAVTPDTGAPIISSDGVVLSGNGRTMAIKRSVSDAPERYNEYKEQLIKKANKFGLNAEEIGKMKNPVLVKVDNSVREYSVKGLDEYNQKAQKGENPIDKAIKRSAIINADERLKGTIINIISGHETMSDLFANNKDRKSIIGLFIENGIITKQESNEYINEDGTLTDNGKDLINDVLLATMVSPETMKASESVKAFRNKIINALPVLTTNYNNAEYSLEGEVNGAIKLQAELVASGYKQEDFWKFVNQIKIGEPHDPNVVLINRLISSGERNFKDFVLSYNESTSLKDGGLFGDSEVMPKQEVLDKLKEIKLNEDEKKIIAGVEDIYGAFANERQIGNAEVPKGEKGQGVQNEEGGLKYDNQVRVDDLKAELGEAIDNIVKKIDNRKNLTQEEKTSLKNDVAKVATTLIKLGKATLDNVIDKVKEYLKDELKKRGLTADETTINELADNIEQKVLFNDAIQYYKDKGLSYEEVKSRLDKNEVDYEEADLKDAWDGKEEPAKEKSGGSVTGISIKAREKRAEELKTTATESGQGWTGKDALERGQELLNKGADANKVIEEYNRTKKISGDDIAILQAHANELARETNQAGEKFGIDSPEYNDALKKEQDFLDAAKPLSTESHLAFAAHQGASDVDTGSWVGMVRQFEADNGKKPTKQQVEEIKKLSEQVNKETKRADDLQQKLYDELNKIHDTIPKEEADNLINEAYEKGKKDGGSDVKKFTKKAKELADRFRQLKSKPLTLKDENGNEIKLTQNSILSLNDIIELGAKAIETTGKIADGISVVLDKLKEQDFYKNLSDKGKEAVNKQVEEHFNSTAESKEKLGISQNDARDLFNEKIKDNPDYNITDLVNDIIKENPDLEGKEREVRDEITGYGETKTPNEEDAQFRKAKRLGRIISALEDIANGERPKKSGLQRDTKDPEERAKAKELADALKKLPLSDADLNKKLKTAQDTIVTRLNNEIADMQREIDNKKRNVRPHTATQTTKEIEDLKVKRDAKKAERDALFAHETEKDIQEYFANRTDGDFTLDETRMIWKYAKEKYVDKGISDFNKMTNAVATDLGLSQLDIINALAKPKSARTISDEMYKTQSRRRDAINNAKHFIKSANEPALNKFLKYLPTFWFQKAVFGHGTVGMITHAGVNMFRPTEWGTYFRNFVRQFQFVNKVTHEKFMTAMQNEADFTFWKRHGLAIEPHKIYDDYQAKRGTGWISELSKVGDRGFDALKVYRYEQAKNIWSNLNDYEKTPESAKAIARMVNASTGTVEGQVNPLVSSVIFAPKLEASRWKRLVKTPIETANTFKEWKTASVEDKILAKLAVRRTGETLATMAVMLAANQAILSLFGDDKTKINFTDPTESDFLKFKVADKTVDISGGMFSTVRFIAILAELSLNEAKGNKNIADEMYKKTGKQIRGKLSPFFSTTTDIATHKDFAGNVLPFYSDSPGKYGKKLSWWDYIGQSQLPIPISAAWRDIKIESEKNKDGKAKVNDILSGIITGATMGFTGAHVGEDYSKEDKKEESVLPAGVRTK